MSSDGPPYMLPTAQLGGLPQIMPDVPILGVFLSYYTIASLLCLFSVHQMIRRQQSFIIALLMYLVTGEREVACIMQIVWAYRITDVRIALASQIFLQAGVILIYLMNVTLAGRFLRTLFGNRAWLRFSLVALSILTVASFVMVITTVVISVYTLDQHSRKACRDVQRAAATYIVILATTPTVMLAVCYIKCQKNSVDRNLRTMMTITMISALLCMVMAVFKAGVIWETPRPVSSPAWYHSNTCLYAFDLGLEVLIFTMFIVTRMDLKFDLLVNHQNDIDWHVEEETQNGSEKKPPQSSPVIEIGHE